ncbi:alpha/beta fold hydrolase [Gloeobacter kilaueensis]|uniref:Haloalkane dehalogenase n=1 Tax=Gloeobacter kilaueensis (strain ATCC BAA-2537 / CCAP 1431/1 / ULC 316 / JS1) TaxID=1183438 RepID=U5QLG5_GLOK1|nr:alpha/beta fold hydrolase [Gloeobacter kilaueensis]AGY59733.1 haloalkane dehalogenase [Gloeobacter kilaueensis JS1]
MIPADETFEGTFVFTPHFLDVVGFRMHYVYEGTGQPILLHGEPTWGYLFRQVIPRLAERYRVIVPDLTGFGKSETTQGWECTVLTQVDNLEALILVLDLEGITLLVHDWGGVIGGGVALRHPECIARIVVTSGAVPLGTAREAELTARNVAEAEYFRWMARLHRERTLETVLSHLGHLVLALMLGLQGFENRAVMNQTWLSAYSLPFCTPPECLGAIAFPKSIVDGTVRFEIADAGAVAALRNRPATMIVGMQDRVLKPEYLRAPVREAFPDAPVHRLHGAGHFLYEDEPEAITLLIDQFIQYTGRM